MYACIYFAVNQMRQRSERMLLINAYKVKIYYNLNVKYNTRGNNNNNKKKRKQMERKREIKE